MPPQLLKRQWWSRGFAGRGGREYAKANAVASETMASDRMARAGGEIDGLEEANGAVLATPREEATEEH